MKKNILIVGAGFSGATIANQLSHTDEFNILVVDEREHIGGNCHTSRDPETGVMVHQYGPHIFHTNRLDVWDYIRQFSGFGSYTNRVKAVTDRGVFSLPINLLTINQYFSKQFSPQEARQYIQELGESSIESPQSLEEQALKFLGRELYESFFKGYTIKQWGCDPSELPASILKRLPVRFSYDDNYYHSKYQGIPFDGYTAIIKRMLNSPNITVKTHTHYDPSWNESFDYVFYSGPIDAYYNYSKGRLGYRTVYFKKQRVTGDYQGNAVINYCQSSIPHTRVHEHKHFTPWETHEKSIVLTEYSKETQADDIPYYPKRLTQDKYVLQQYREIAQNESNISFIGRLATYRYMDMHHVLGEALDLSHEFLKCPSERWSQFKRFPNTEEIILPSTPLPIAA